MKKLILSLGAVGILSLGIFNMGGFQSASASVADNAPKTASYGNCGGVKSYIDQGLSFEEAKKKMLDVKFANIDKSVKEGTMTKQQGDYLKAKIKERSSTCTTPGQNKGKGMGLGQGMGLCQNN
ncbi:hypothetical protein [Clostridium cylindrosporum]|uniref:DUF2680 domain-containing protein n=1 Tax=Clostridium cylindrosporum DSM 605 TaxID=1121307 RepID=A0A0J8D9I6_CLOCY|nr:hypothetical protein [Clostridium cylindrosporum]KMT20984.1 hypothetical protein CLCY_1c02180 [Clostridium cylindrosporum DSM 605]